MDHDDRLADARLIRYQKTWRNVRTPFDVLRILAGNVEVYVEAEIQGRREKIAVPLGEIVHMIVNEKGEPLETWPVQGPDPPEKLDDITNEFLKRLSSLAPSGRKDSVVVKLSDEEWRGLSAPLPCLPVAYVPYDVENADERWGIYLNTPLLADLFVNVSGEWELSVIHNLYTLVNAVPGVSVSAEALLGAAWRHFMSIWAGFALACHTLHDIFTAQGRAEKFFEYIRSSDATRLALLVALAEPGGFGITVLTRPLLKCAPATRVSGARDALIRRLTAFMAAVSCHQFFLDPEELPSPPERLLKDIQYFWSPFWLAHLSGISDPLLVRTGTRFRGIKGFVRALGEAP